MYVHTVSVHTYVYTVYIPRTKGVYMYVYCMHTYTYVSVRGYVRVVASVCQVNECVLCAHVCLLQVCECDDYCSLFWFSKVFQSDPISGLSIQGFLYFVVVVVAIDAAVAALVVASVK